MRNSCALAISYSDICAMVEKQSEMVRSKYNVNAVAFRVETVDGKVKLRKPLSIEDINRIAAAGWAGDLDQT